MSTEFMDIALTQVHDVINRLQRPIPDLPTLLALLSGPLDRLGLLPPQFRGHNTAPLPSGALVLSKHIPPLQRALLDHIAPTWDAPLEEAHATLLLEQYFCPDSFSFAAQAAGDVALLAYATIVAQPLSGFAVGMLARLAVEYPVDRLHEAVFSLEGGAARDYGSRQMLRWEDYIRSIAMIPGKVANSRAGKDIPPVLEHGTYFNNICSRCECLIASLSTRSGKDAVASVSYLLAKLANLGVFPSTPPVSRSQPSFFQTNLGTIRARLEAEGSTAYSAFWASLIQGLPSSLVLQSVFRSLFASLSPLERVADGTPLQRAHVKQEARVLAGISGSIAPEKGELWQSACAIILERDWNISYARIFVCWISNACYSGKVDLEALDAFLKNILDMWTSQDYIKHSLLSRHQYVTSLLLVVVSYFPASSKHVESLSFSPTFVSAIGTYVSHLDSSVRRCGMLVAEVVAQLSGKKLDFKDWDGDDAGKPWARDIRELIKHRDVDADIGLLDSVVPPEVVQVEEVIATDDTPQVSEAGEQRVTFTRPHTDYDSDDSLTGYQSPPSSRSASPTPSELADIEKDPSLNVGVKKVMRPVYLMQLGELFRGTGLTKGKDEPHEADKIEMGLNCAEELIRKKRGYGTELDENAVNLVYGLLGLQDNYDLDGFEVKRQNAMNALIACSPRKAAPALIEEFFKNQYSTSQRYVALNALALGAREMASLPLPPSTMSIDRVSFPSKTLPAPLHRKYISSSEQDAIPLIMDSISSLAIERGKDATAERVPELIRERRLRLQKPRGITEVSSSKNSLPLSTQSMVPKVVPFTEVATEFFIGPLMNRFWLFLRDEQIREERTARYEGRHRYHGAGTGLILNPVVLSHFLRTLAILVHASQNAPEWQAVVAPGALELAVTLGTKPISHMGANSGEEGDEGSRGKEASVLTSALELALVVLDGCLELDAGRAIGLEHTVLLLGVGEWANGVFASLEKGLRVEGGGGVHEVKLRRAAAGVLLKVDEMTSKWRRSMLDTR